MTSEYWKKRAKELEQTHMEPAHVTQRKTVNAQMPGLPQPGGFNHGQGDIDLTSKLMDRIAQQQMNHNQNPMPSSQESQMVFVKEGVTGFRPLQTDGFSNVEMAINIGPLSGLVGKEFQVKGVRNVYIVDSPNGPAIDLMRLDQSRMTKLVLISAPFVGSYYVSENAIMRQGSSGQKLLKG